MSDENGTYQGEAGSLEYRMHMDEATMTVKLLYSLPLGQMARHIERCHAVGPMLDPTAYRDGMRNLEEQEAVVSALLAARKVIEKNPRLAAAFTAATAGKSAR